MIVREGFKKKSWEFSLIGTPNIGDPSPSAPKISDPSLNLGVGTPNIGDPSPCKKSWET